MSSTVTARSALVTQPRSAALTDVAIAAVALVGTLALLSRHGVASLQHGPEQLGATSVLLAACSTLPLVAWRRAPHGVFLVTAGASIGLAASGYSVAVPLGPTLALYLLAASREDRALWTRADTALALALFGGYLGATAIDESGFPGTELAHAGLAWAVAWFAGERTRLRREQIAELRERALRAAREAEQERRLAVAEERTRIARDLHDSAGHAINVIAVRAGTARLRHDKDPERSRAALEAIEEVARQTVEEIDQIVGSLREPEFENGDQTTPPGLASLGSLIEHRSETGLEVNVTTEGAARPLSPAVDLAAYRILQEALTNATRHGEGAADVELTFGDDALAITVTNPMTDGGAPSMNGGHGLIGMRERATSLGGSFDTDHADGGFRLRARLPYEPHPT